MMQTGCKFVDEEGRDYGVVDDGGAESRRVWHLSLKVTGEACRVQRGLVGEKEN